MKSPRVTIAGIMSLVALVAIDWVALANLKRIESVPLVLFTLGGLPMANTLALALAFRARGGETGVRRGRFLVGFLVLGLVVLLCYAAIAVVFPEACMALLQRALKYARGLATALGLGKGFTVEEVATIAITMAFYTVPQICFATVGGLIHRRQTR